MAWCLQRGEASGLFLPQVARENHWDSERLLRESVRQGRVAHHGLETATTRSCTTFEGFSIAGPFDAGQLPAMPPRYSPPAVAALSDHCGRNSGTRW